MTPFDPMLNLHSIKKRYKLDGQEREEVMRHNKFFETGYRFAEQLKGGPLRESEKDHIIKGFEEGSGIAFNRMCNAIADVLHTDFIVMKERIRRSDDLKRLKNRLREEAYEWESYIKT